ncbi:MAG: DUF1573 domain-containing protein [Verrucomicrobiota bacterium]
MKIVFSIWLTLFACTHAAGLDFTETRKELHAPEDAKVVTTDFDFTNHTDKPVTIRKYDAACSCIAVKIQGGKLRYEPGESGVVRTEFDMGNFYGTVDKTVLIWQDDDPEAKPSITLTAHVIIPTLVSIEPKTLKWEVNGKPDPQTIRINMAYTKPIKIVSVSSTSEAYSHELKTIEEGKSYELVVTPLDLKTPGLAIYRLTTDCAIDKFKVQQAFAQVRRPDPVTAAPKP